MAYLNRISIIGRLGHAPRMAGEGDSRRASFSVATQRGKDAPTQWHRCTAWAQTADLVERYLDKGSLVYVDGEMQYREYEHDGQQKTSAEIRVLTVQFLDSGRRQRGEESPAAQQPGDDEIPF